MFKELDIEHQGKIEYLDFIKGSINFNTFFDGKNGEIELYQDIFGHYDLNGDGFITKDEMERSMTKFGIEVSTEDLRSTMKTYDTDGDD